MGLRINTNANAITALTNLRRTDDLLSRSLERLSTGLRINRASDDPAGLVISEQFRAQIASLKQAVENTQFDSNLIGTAEGALQEIDNLLVKIRESAIFAKNTGGISDEQIEAEQDAVDSAIAAIDRIAATTRFGRRNLLNGAANFVTSAAANSGIKDLTIRSVFMGPTSSIIFDVQIVTRAARASSDFGAIALDAGESSVAFRITGPLGTVTVTFQSSATVGMVSNAIDANRSFTGVYASGTRAFSDEFGSDVAVSLELIDGTAAAGEFVRGTGRDTEAIISGATVDADGLDIRFQSPFLKGQLTLSAGLAGGTSPSFAVTDYSGLVFQLGSEPTGADQIRVGIAGVDSSRLGFTEVLQANGGGTIGGFVSSITAGGDNDLKTNPTNAISIVDRALDQVNGLRGFLGALDADTLGPNERSQNVAIENLTASESEIRDLDFAAETSEFTRQQILFNAGTAVLAAANVVPQQVLTLLGV